MRKTAYLLWLIASFFAFFQFFLQTATSILSIEWVRDFHLNKVELSNLSSAFFYTYTLMQIPAGILFDRYSPRYLLTCALLILTVGILLLSSTSSYAWAFFARLLMGVGSSFGFIGLLQVCASHFPANRFAIILGLSEGISMLAVTGGIMLLSWVISFYSWRFTLAGCGTITFILMLLTYYFFGKPVVPLNPHEKHDLSFNVIFQQLNSIFTNQQMILGSLYGFFMFSIVTAFTSLWGFLFLTHTYNMTDQLAANMIATVFIGIAIGGPGSGWLAKILEGRKPILVGAAALATILMSIIIFCPHLPSTLLFILLFLMGLLCAAYIQCFAIIKDVVHPSVRATALAASNMIIMFGAPILQLWIGGLLQDSFFGWAKDIAMNYRLSLSILPAGMLIACLLSLWIKEPA
jgi:MFS family permease